MSQTPSRIVLVTARSLIAERRSWLQNGWFRPGHRIVRRCAYQAVVDAARMHGLPSDRPLALLAEAMQPTGRSAVETIPLFNDTHPHADVLATFDRAIALT